MGLEFQGNILYARLISSRKGCIAFRSAFRERKKALQRQRVWFQTRYLLSVGVVLFLLPYKINVFKVVRTNQLRVVVVVEIEKFVKLTNGSCQT